MVCMLLHVQVFGKNKQRIYSFWLTLVFDLICFVLLFLTGQCIDTIKQGTSTLADAGRGAFATRDFSKGSIVTVAPLVTINDKKLAMQTNNRTSALPWEVSPQQLLLNYCFGHAKAELLLCPASHAAMINHDPKEPNLEIRWARTGQREHDYTSGLKQELLEMDSNDMQSYNSKIMLEYVAIGDIRAGEELFLNYGQEWEDALQNHLAHGVSKAADVELVSAKQLNQENATLEVSTSEAMKNHSYLCSIYPNVKIGEVNANWEEFSSNRAVDKASWPTDLKALYQHNDFAGLYPCRVVEADNIQKLYSIEMFIKPLSRNFVGRRYHNVPRNRIRFSDNLYRSDQHLSWAFRHYIPIPDSIFPLRWRDDYKPASYWSLGKDARVQGTQNIAEGYELAARNAKCGVYIAPSNIPNAGKCSLFQSYCWIAYEGHSVRGTLFLFFIPCLCASCCTHKFFNPPFFIPGFGTYTAIDIPAGALVVASSMPVIPEMTGPKSNKAPVRRWPGRDYVWGGHQFGASNEAHPIWSTSMLAVMFGSLANAHTGITNLYQDSGKYEPVLDRREDPGAGASSDYIGYSFRSAYPVPAGEELFVSYGEQWYVPRRGAVFFLAVNHDTQYCLDKFLLRMDRFVQRKQFNDVPLKKHFMHANDILAAIWSLVALDDAAVQGRNIPILLQVIRDRVIDQPRTRSALSSIKTPDDLRHIVGRNGTAQATVEAKSINWLEKYGEPSERNLCPDDFFVFLTF